MATHKVSVTLESEAITRARAVAGPRGLSSYLDVALHEKLERDERRAAFLALLEELTVDDPIPARTRSRAAARSAELRAAVEG